MSKNYLLVLIVLMGVKSSGFTTSAWEFTASAVSVPILSVTASNDAKKGFLGELYNPLGVKYNWSKSYAALATSKLSLISNKDKDKGLSTYMTQLEFGYFWTDSSEVRFKTHGGLLSYEMKGAGGQKELPNGNTTATFDLPSRTSTAQMAFFGLGGLYNFESFNLGMDLNIFSLLSSERRNFTLSFNLGIPL